MIFCLIFCRTNPEFVSLNEKIIECQVFFKVSSKSPNVTLFKLHEKKTIACLPFDFRRPVSLTVNGVAHMFDLAK